MENCDIIRLSEKYRGSFCKTLSALKPCELSSQEFWDIHNERNMSGVDTYIVLQNEECVATASMFFERKFINNGGIVAHIEDVAVRPDLQLKGLGKLIMTHCEKMAKTKGCYKVILNCNDDNVGFYEKLGYYKKENQMRKDI